MTLYHDADCVSAIELGVATPNVIPLASIGQFSNALFNFYFACWFILLHTSLSSNACHSERLTIVNNLLMVAPSWKRVKPDIALLAAAKIVFLPDSKSGSSAKARYHFYYFASDVCSIFHQYVYSIWRRITICHNHLNVVE